VSPAARFKGIQGTWSWRAEEGSFGIPLSDNPPLPLVTLPFPFGLPRNGGGIALRPGHYLRITPAGRAPESLSQVTKPAAAGFAFKQDAAGC